MRKIIMGLLVGCSFWVFGVTAFAIGNPYITGTPTYIYLSPSVMSQTGIDCMVVINGQAHWYYKTSNFYSAAVCTALATSYASKEPVTLQLKLNGDIGEQSIEFGHE